MRIKDPFREDVLALNWSACTIQPSNIQASRNVSRRLKLTMMRLPAGFQFSFRLPSNILCPHSTRTIDLIAAFRTVHSLSSHIKCSTAIALCRCTHDCTNVRDKAAAFTA